MATSLRSDDCANVEEAYELFQSEKGLLVLRCVSYVMCCDVLGNNVSGIEAMLYE